MPKANIRTIRIAALLLAVFLASSSTGNAAKKKQAPTDAEALIQRAAENEVAALKDPLPSSYFQRLQWSWGTETRRVIQIDDAAPSRIVEFNDEPLGPDQLAKQIGYLQRLLADRDTRKHELEEDRAETRRRIHMMESFPKAFVFEPAGEALDGLLKFTFTPKPGFSPPSKESQVYRGMTGTVWLSPKAERLARIEGFLTRDVSFGWGIFGKLDKGGRYEIEQKQTSPGVWHITRLNLDVKGRAFLSGFRLRRDERDAEFRHIRPATTFQTAVELLLQSSMGPAKGAFPTLEAGQEKQPLTK
ncbi:MAG TPA: hypothetical protein VJN64_08050 [Terriglobales bacterium]|nr:hypothetical protein [Terriglobales bacterium]